MIFIILLFFIFVNKSASKIRSEARICFQRNNITLNSPVDKVHFHLIFAIAHHDLSCCYRGSRSHPFRCERGGSGGSNCVCDLLCVSLLPRLSSCLHLESPWRATGPIASARQRPVDGDIYSALSPHQRWPRQAFTVHRNIPWRAAPQNIQDPQSKT